MNEKEPTQSNPDFWDNLGKLLLDLAKLTFASFILGGNRKTAPQRGVYGNMPHVTAHKKCHHKQQR